MKSRTTNVDRTLVAGVTVVLIVIGAAGFSAFGAAAILPFIAVCLGISLLVQLEAMRRSDRATSRLKQEAVNDFRQVESLLYLVSMLRPEVPLPDTRDGAASPDFLKKTVELMAMRRPNLVVEAGSGVSTLVIGYCLKRQGIGKVISLEHDPGFARIARDWIALHGLEAFAVVVDAPLTSVPLGDQNFLWYDTRDLHFSGPIDLLVVDAPPGTTQPLARYPALPILMPHLSKNALILMDDGLRADEQLIAKRWTAEFPGLSSEFLPLEKGAFLLSRAS